MNLNIINVFCVYKNVTFYNSKSNFFKFVEAANGL